MTFCTKSRVVLCPVARDMVAQECIRGHGERYWLDCLTVMPDHVHLIVFPYETTTISEVLRLMKGASSYGVNSILGRSGPLWQRESFDRMIRSEESLSKKREYIFNNPVRAGLVARWEDYPWNWSPSL